MLAICTQRTHSSQKYDALNKFGHCGRCTGLVARTSNFTGARLGPTLSRSSRGRSELFPIVALQHPAGTLTFFWILLIITYCRYAGRESTSTHDHQQMPLHPSAHPVLTLHIIIHAQEASYKAKCKELRDGLQSDCPGH